MPLSMRKGIEFEAAWVAERARQVAAAGGRCVDVSPEGSARASQRDQLDQAIAQRVELIGQAPLSARGLGGYADLLELADDGDGSRPWYAPVEIKSAKTVRAAHVLQLCAYIEAIELKTGVAPRYGFIVTWRRHATPNRCP